MVTRSGAERGSRKKILKNISVEQISRSVPFCLEYKEPFTNNISIQQSYRSVPCNKEAATNNITVELISRSVPFCLEYKEHFTNSISIQQIIGTIFQATSDDEI